MTSGSELPSRVVGAQVYDGGCPVGCAVDEDCVGDLGPGVCAGGQCCDLTDVSEVLSVLAAVQNGLNAPCDHPCPPGACEVPASVHGFACCRDGSHLSGPGPDQGTSRLDCFTVGGTWLGENTRCAESSPLPPCPG